MRPPIKLALISTPRSGNTWLRHVLAGLYELEQYAIHDPATIDWSTLGDRCIVQVHWNKTPSFRDLLRSNNFRVVTIARHPLDVLVSILHFAPNEPQTANWLLGQGGNEASIHGKTPESPEFLEYCQSERAVALLAVTPQWWTETDSILVGYEDLVHRKIAAIAHLPSLLGVEPVKCQEVFEGLSLAKLRESSMNRHFWQGQPGLWRSLITAKKARQMLQAHTAVLKALGYSCDPDESLAREQAIQNWARL